MVLCEAESWLSKATVMSLGRETDHGGANTQLASTYCITVSSVPFCNPPSFRRLTKQYRLSLVQRAAQIQSQLGNMHRDACFGFRVQVAGNVQADRPRPDYW